MSRKVINIVTNSNKSKIINFESAIIGDANTVTEFSNVNVSYPNGITFEDIKKLDSFDYYIGGNFAIKLQFVGVTQQEGVDGYVFCGCSLTSLKTYLFIFTESVIVYVSR